MMVYLCNCLVRVMSIGICLNMVFFSQNVWASQSTSDTHSNNELGSAIIEVFDPLEFDGDASNWYMEQHANGTMFLANNSGLYSFDGTKWRKHPQSGPGHINQFTILDERIYVGLKGDLGFYTTHVQGDLTYQSLLSEIPADKRCFGSIRNVFQFEGRVYFISAEQIMAYHPQSGVQIYLPQDHFRRAWLAGDRLFATDGDGLIYLQNNKIHGVDVMPKEGLGRIGFVQSLGQDFLIGSMKKGVFLWSENQLIPWIDSERPEAAYAPYNSIHINEKIIAIATLRNGVIFVDHAGRLIYHLNKENGLPADTTLNLFLDQQQGLWLSQQTQVSRVQLPFELSVFTSGKEDVYGVYGITRHLGQLYLAAISGYMRIDQSGKTTRIEDVNTSGQDIISVHGNLLLAGATQCQIYDPIKLQLKTLLKTAKCNDFLLSKIDPSLLFIATGTGILLSQWNGSDWSTPTQILVEHRVASKMLEDAKGQIWLSNGDNQLVKIHKPKSEWQVSKIDFTDPLIKPLILDGQLLVSTENGLFHWNDKNNKTVGKVAWFYDYFGNEAEPPTFLHRDAQQRVWLSNSTEAGFVRLKEGKIEQWSNYVGAAIGTSKLHSVYDDGNITWLGFDKGLVRFNSIDDNNRVNQNLKVRANISEIYNKATHLPLALNLFGQSEQVIEGQYETTSMRIFFALSNYLKRQDNEFRYRLDEDAWSAWSKETFVDLGHLNGGHYLIQMQAKDPQNQLYTADSRSIYIIPPWYLSKTAIGFYILSIIAMLGVSAWFAQRMRTAKLKQQNLLLENQVNERTAEVQAQAQELKQQQILKDRFFANVSHEFRTPLTLTIGPLKTLLEENAQQLDDSGQSLANTALNNANKMLALVGQVLDMNRLEAGKLLLHIGHYDVAELLRNLQQRFSHWAEQENQKIVCNHCLDPQYLYVDLDQIEKCIANLLSNAIKYSGKGCNIVLQLEQNKNDVIIQVIDDGKGIKNVERDKVFERFYQAHDSENLSTPGTGIGLALVKEIVELHQGSVTLTTGSEQGCCFSITLKKGHTHFSKDQIVEPISLSITQQIEKPIQEKITQNDNDHTTLLIVDDNEELRQFISLRLSASYKILQAENGQQGLTSACEHLPDLIISDVMMPIMTGLEMTRKLKSAAATKTIPVILLTAKSTKRETVEGFNAGADDYLTKPFDTSELVMRVNALINARKNVRQNMAFEQSADTLQLAQKSPLSKRITQHIEQHLSDPGFTVNKLAQMMHMSSKTLTRKCNSEMGMSPLVYVNQIRIHHATNLLKDGKLTISEIGYALGFESLAYFSRNYKKHTGKSPSEVNHTKANSNTFD